MNSRVSTIIISVGKQQSADIVLLSLICIRASNSNAIGARSIRVICNLANATNNKTLHIITIDNNISITTTSTAIVMVNRNIDMPLDVIVTIIVNSTIAPNITIYYEYCQL